MELCEVPKFVSVSFDGVCRPPSSLEEFEGSGWSKTSLDGLET